MKASAMLFCFADALGLDWATGRRGDRFDMRRVRRILFRHWRAPSAAIAAGAVALAILWPISAAAEEGPVSAAPKGQKISIESLLKAGWRVAGYTSTLDERSAFILFRNPNENYLVQCRAGYDVTRTPRVFSNCYEMH
jgi:hypothetical protein